MNHSAWLAAAALCCAVSGCSGNPSSSSLMAPAANPPAGAGSSTDFMSFVNQQLDMQPPMGATPAATDALAGDLALDDPGAWASVAFGAGDALPDGTDQAAVECTQDGARTCDPARSADLNSGLN